MNLSLWIMAFSAYSLFLKWVISWGGAKVIEGWTAGLFFGWLVNDLNSEQIRAYALIIWVVSGIWFVLGLFNPAFRFIGIYQPQKKPLSWAFNVFDGGLNFKDIHILVVYHQNI